MTYSTDELARLGYVARAQSYTGTVEGSVKHREIRNIYNGIDPLPRSYAIKASDDWCAAFVSAMGWAEGHQDWPYEVSVPRIVLQAKELGIWRPGPWAPPGIGAWIVFDWDHNGAGNHIGIITTLNGDVITTVEGNFRNRVEGRTTKVGHSDILGYVDLDFSGCVAGNRPLRPGDIGNDVLLLQMILKGAGYYVGLPDGAYGEKTTAAVMDFQRLNALQVDGKAGPETQAKIRTGDFTANITTDEEVDAVEIKRYKRIDEVPEYARPTVAKLIDRGWLLGTDVDDLGLTDDLIRMLVINDRAGLYGMAK